LSGFAEIPEASNMLTVTHDREELARRYGFASFTELLAISRPLPRLTSGETQCYVAHRPDGIWFVWNDVPPEEAETRKDHDSGP
jgi:hypothetical protein